jgi:hypothetical protein
MVPFLSPIHRSFNTSELIIIEEGIGTYLNKRECFLENPFL